MISATIFGRLGKDAELRKAGQSDVAGFSVATDHGYGDKRVTTWVEVSVWGKQAQWCADNLRKGEQVVAAGSLFEDAWKDRDGNERKRLKLDANEIKKVYTDAGGGEGRRDERKPAARSRGGGGRDEAPVQEDSEIPFLRDDGWRLDRIVR